LPPRKQYPDGSYNSGYFASRWEIVAFFSFSMLLCCDRAQIYDDGCCSARLIGANKFHANLPGTPAGAMTWTAEYDLSQPMISPSSFAKVWIHRLRGS
jgi:hypothetical protein